MAAILTENAQAGDKAIFDDIIERAYPGYKKMTANAILQKMISDGVIQVESLVVQMLPLVPKSEQKGIIEDLIRATQKVEQDVIAKMRKD